MEGDYNVNEKYKKAEETLSYANQIAEQDSGRNKSLEGVHFDTYQDVGGDRMYRKMEGGRILDTFTQEEMDKGIESRKEDPFYNFDTSDTVSLQPTDERDFVQALPDDASIHKVGEKISEYYILTAVQNGSLSTITVPKWTP